MHISDNSAALSLKISPELKMAIQSLCYIHFREEPLQGQNCTPIQAYFTKNDVAIMLLLRGLRSVFPLTQKSVKEVSEKVDRFGALMATFEANPSARSIHPSDLPAESDLREWLAQIIEEDVPHPDKGAERRWVENKHITSIEYLERLCAATQVIESALE